MSEKEFKEYRKQLQDYGKKLSKSPEESFKLLKKAGIIDKSGKLTPQYK